LRAKGLAVRRINDSQSSAPRQFKSIAKNVDTIRIQANELEAIDRIFIAISRAEISAPRFFNRSWDSTPPINLNRSQKNKNEFALFEYR